MIFYGVHGEGLGHAIRALSIIELFPNVDFVIFTHKDAYKYLVENKPKNLHLIYKVKGLEFYYKAGRVVGCTNPFRIESLYQKKNRSILEQVYNEVGKEKVVKACLTDWELSVSRFARDNALPCISIDNQHKFRFGNFSDLNLSFSDNLKLKVAKKFCSWVIPYANQYIVVTFSNPDSDECVWAPILASTSLKEIKNQRVFCGRAWDMVYCKPETFKYIKPKLNDPFVRVYCSLKVDHPGWKEINRKNFLQDLIRCNKLYTNAGNTLLSEACYLDIETDVTPIKSHFEQRFNALCIEKGCGQIYDGSSLVQAAIEKYL